jgi:hypothetical protein
MHEPMIALGQWWSVTDANPTALAVAVVAIALGAVGFVGHRVWSRRR